MKKIITFLVLLLCTTPVFAATTSSDITKETEIQTRIDSVAVKLLNNNKITKRIIFTYDKRTKKKALSTDKALTKRQIIIYDGLYQHIQTDDELAAMMAREIATAMKSYDGSFGGWIDSAQVALGSKKFETVSDKRAVDYLVNAGYNPLAVIIFINKTCPQKRHDTFSRHNLTSKRLARVYEYITFKYPQYLENNEYINNEYYQNFLLTSIENRKKLEDKIRTKSTKDVDYE